MKTLHFHYLTLAIICLPLLAKAEKNISPEQMAATSSTENSTLIHHEAPNDPWMPRPQKPFPNVLTQTTSIVRDGFVSVQVNVDEFGQNIPGDAANEPSITIDPTDPRKIAIGWRQFDTIESDFRQAGYGYSQDAGFTWTFPGSLTPGVFGSDPVLDTDASGVFYYISISYEEMRLFKSYDRGAHWEPPIIVFSGLYDKPWMAIDRTNSIGQGHIYLTWELGEFGRSQNDGKTFETIPYDRLRGLFGNFSVGTDGELYITGSEFNVHKSINAKDPCAVPTFELVGENVLNGLMSPQRPNGVGLAGQPWIATDHSNGPFRGNVYVLGTVVDLDSYTTTTNIAFARGIDHGTTWDQPVRINDDPIDSGAVQWFGTLSVAPNGRIDAIWNDTRNTKAVNYSELYYSYSVDGGVTWAENIPVSPVFDSWIGWPYGQHKIGDYYHMISDNSGANVAYAATFNGEQDIYFLRIPFDDCNMNGIIDLQDITNQTSDDCNLNQIPDECERDCNNNGIADECEVDDQDEDQILDDCDNCVLVSNFAQSDRDRDGVGDACDLYPDDPTNTGDPDGNFTITDFPDFVMCFSGPCDGQSCDLQHYIEFCCTPFDFDGDQDVDLYDAAQFMNTLDQ